ncbi:MAG: proton-conducting transporter membrane subunit [Vicinamibacterales bacterium]
MMFNWLSAPLETLAICLVLLTAPRIGSPIRRGSSLPIAALAVALVLTLLATDGRLAYGVAAAAAVLHAITAWPSTRTGAVWLAGSGLLAAGAAAGLAADQLTAAFLLSTLAIAVRAGVLPFHAGVASLCDRAPLVQTQQLASTVALVFVHLRFVDHHDEAIALAPIIVRFGAFACLAAALMSTVQKDLRGFFRSTTSMHGGMVLAALGAASLHNYAAALLVTVSASLAIGGLGTMVASLEARVGPVVYGGTRGLAQALPRLATAFALLAAAGVAVPGSVGFVADDLLLHALWRHSPASTVVVILSASMLAVSTLICYSHVFLGRPTAVLAPDLLPRERVVAVLLVLVILLLGFAPGGLLYPAERFLTPTEAIAGGPAGS